jgi:hypothetical protein
MQWAKLSVSKIAKKPPASTIIGVRWGRHCAKASAWRVLSANRTPLCVLVHMSLSRLNHWLPRGQAHTEVLQGPTAFPHQIANTLLPQAAPVFHTATALHTAVDRRDPEPAVVPGLVGPCLLRCECLAAWFLRRPADCPRRERARQAAQRLQELASGRERVGGDRCAAQSMPTPAVGVAPQEARAEGLDEHDMVDGVVCLLAALTRALFRSVLGAAAAPFRPVMGTRGEAGAPPGTAPPGAGSSSSGPTTGAAAASETPRRWARAGRERAGAAPRARRAARRTGRRTCIHGVALLWPIPTQRPCITWRA